jgi:hypothetical protein
VKLYVVVVESVDESGQRGVDNVYAGPGGEGFVYWEADLAQKALVEWLEASGAYRDKVARAVIVELSPVPHATRVHMVRAVQEAEQAQRARLKQTRLAVVTSVAPPVTELWETTKEERA